MENQTEAAESNIKKVHGSCRMCHLNCPIWVYVQDGKAIKVEADPTSIFSVGRQCARMAGLIQFQYSPTRVKYPLKRIGKRGEGKWKRISWDQAIEEIAEKTHNMIEKYGAESIVLPGRTNRHDMGWVAHKIARSLGTPNNYYGPIQVCYLPIFLESFVTGNLSMGMLTGSSDVELFIGWEFGYTVVMMTNMVPDALAAGTKLIVVDPVCGPFASKADEWVPIRPGTDLAFAMGLIRILIEKDMVDKTYIKQWTNSAFLVRSDTGALLMESDIKSDGSDSRYMVWDQVDNRPKYWDTKRVMWEGGPSGAAHYQACVDRFNNKEPSFDISPAAELPDNIDPALFGNYKVTLKNGADLPVKPVYQQLKENVDEWTPEKVEEVTWVPADQTRRIAQMLGEAESPAVNLPGQYMATNLAQCMQALYILRAMLKVVDEVEGGCSLDFFYPVTPQYFPTETDIAFFDGLPMETKRKRLGYYQHRVGCGFAYEEWEKWHPLRPLNVDALPNWPDVGCVLEAIETGRPYPVKGIFSISSNFLMHDPALGRWIRALEDEDTIELHVCTEIVMTPTAEMADYVLPAVTSLERSWMDWGGSMFLPEMFVHGQALEEPLGEAKHDYDFGYLLSEAMGKYDKCYVEGQLNSEHSHFFAGEYGKFYQGATIDEFRDTMTRRFLNMPYEDVVKAKRIPLGKPGPMFRRHHIAGKWPTDTGKINVFNTLYQWSGYPALPVYTEPAESPYSRPDLAAEYPLVLSTGKRQPGFFHSEFRQVPTSREESPNPYVFINPKTAAEFGIEEGDWIWVESPPTEGRAPYNKIMGKASFRFMVLPGFVSYSQHAWWRPEKSVEEDLHGAFEWNAEGLTQATDRCPETGTPGMRSLLCKIYNTTPEDIEKYQPDFTREQLMALMPEEEE